MSGCPDVCPERGICIVLARETGDPLAIAWASVSLGEVFVLLEDPGAAAPVIDEGRSLFEEQAEPLGMGVPYQAAQKRNS